MKYYFKPKRNNFSKIDRKKYFNECKYELDRQKVLWNMSQYAISIIKDIKSPNLLNLGEVK